MFPFVCVAAIALVFFASDGATAQSSLPTAIVPPLADDGVKVGDIATWFSGIFTAFLFFFTLHQWRQERLRNLALENAAKLDSALAEARKVACWIEKSSTSLRRRTGFDSQSLPDGSWALIIENGASFALFSWLVTTVIKNPVIQLELDNHDRGPIGPNGGLVVIPIPQLSREATPKIAIFLHFTDEHGTTWTRDGNGLRSANSTSL
jgi:hypothetical protein